MRHQVIKRGGGGAPANNHASNCWVPTDDEVMMEVRAHLRATRDSIAHTARPPCYDPSGFLRARPGAHPPSAPPSPHCTSNGCHRRRRRNLHRHGVSRAPGALLSPLRISLQAVSWVSLRPTAVRGRLAMPPVHLSDSPAMHLRCVDGPELTEYAAGYPNRILPSMTACCIFTQILSALRYAHSQGFVHCDIKPQNVRLSAACDRAVLTDWGLAR